MGSTSWLVALWRLQVLLLAPASLMCVRPQVDADVQVCA